MNRALCLVVFNLIREEDPIVTNWTKEAFAGAFKQVLQARLAAAALPHPNQAALQGQLSLLQDVPSTKAYGRAALNAFKPLASAPLGSCTYDIGGTLFCVQDLTQAECGTLNGTWDASNQCSAPSWFAPPE
jgi:hypothetical protein